MKAAAQCRLVWFLVCLLGSIGSILLFAETSRGQSGVRYDVSIEGVSDKDVLAMLKALSGTFAKKEEPPATAYLLNRRVNDDVGLFRQALHSRGYYAVKIDTEINEESRPVHVKFHIETGPLYLLKSVDVEQTDAVEIPSRSVKIPSPEELGLKIGEPSRARSILDAQELLLHKMQAQGYPFVKVVERKVLVDHGIEGVLVTYRIELGPSARFGATTLKGLESVKEDFLKRKLPWKKGDRFNGDLLAEARKRYMETRLFSLIAIKHAEALDADGQLPITIELRERKRRSVKAGVSYATDEGVGVRASWENRNIFHRGEDFKTVLTLSQLVISSENTFKKDDFLRQNQSLNANLRLAREDTDAYTSSSAETSVIVQRELRKGMKIGAGPGFRLSQVEQPGTDQENFALASFPVQFDWDYSDNLLDPTRGGRLGLRTSPYYDLLGSNTGFLKGYLSYSHYLPLLEHPFVLLAARVGMGAMSGAGVDSIPADLRFYAGGGGSIRGYAYQSVSPLDADAKPIGGRSLVEVSAEFRVKITQSIGVVAFWDGGNAFESEYPDFSERLLWGAGAGIRYFTPIGPLRLDVAVPLDRRPDLDSAFQIYVSLGQAF